VYRALNLNTGQMVAVKRIGLEGLKEEEVKQLMREVELVKSLSHPTIVKYEGMVRDESALSIVLECVPPFFFRVFRSLTARAARRYAENGSLGQTLKAFGKLNERLVASYVVKILEGLDYLHTSDVVHCDLKAANILTTKNGNVKLSDFGVSLNLRAMERDLNKDVAGTPNWMAPEVIELKGATTKADIWSLACTVIELLTGRPPYGDIANSMTGAWLPARTPPIANAAIRAVMFRIVEDDMPPLPEGCSGPLLDFLRQCFNKDPERRPSAEVLFEHEWLKTHWGLNKVRVAPPSAGSVSPFLTRALFRSAGPAAAGQHPVPAPRERGPAQERRGPAPREPRRARGRERQRRRAAHVRAGQPRAHAEPGLGPGAGDADAARVRARAGPAVHARAHVRQDEFWET
jgi:serine/threonine protein kinase